MELYSLKIEGFRMHYDTKIIFSDATFLIGENNVGKSSALTAIEYLLSDKKKISDEEFYHFCNHDACNVLYPGKIILTAEFRNLPEESRHWRGFRGRVFPYHDNGETKYKIEFRKTYEVGKDYVVELKEYKRVLKQEFSNCSTINDYIQNGLSVDVANELFPDADFNRNLTAPQKKKILELDDLYNFDEQEEV